MRELLRYPVRGEHAEEALLIGWICLLVHLLFVPAFTLVPAIGYLISVLRSTVNEGEQRATPPPVGWAILRRGVVGGLLLIGYGLVPVAVGATTFGLAGTTSIEPDTGGSFLFLAGSTTTLFVLLSFLYVLPIALCGYAREGRGGAVPGSGFATVGAHAAYFVGWTVALVILGLGWFVGEAVASLSTLGPVLAALWWWYVLLVSTRRIGLAYAATR
ncbi:DUF4013 domain-containing protein [Halalkalicoccus salilacus]|uniref:DUF4013 domain-containing protein n=1 Tax=Halalkalicoccus TaxID=332246 RepID=UPI002F9624E5